MPLIRSFLRIVLLVKIRLFYQVMETFFFPETRVKYFKLLVVNINGFEALGQDYGGQCRYKVLWFLDNNHGAYPVSWFIYFCYYFLHC